MISYKTCTDVTLNQIYEAFSLGFADYFIPLAMDEAEFNDCFFGPEGNQLEYSYIAFDENQPIGLVLSGIRVYDGILTMRCGALCLAKEYRGKGVSDILLQMHKAAAVNAGCKQLFLEVIKENHRAVRFYEKAGYQESTILKYYSNPINGIPSPKDVPPYKISTISYDVIKGFRDKLKACHINWQSDTPYYENSTTEIYLGAYDDYQMIALIAMSAKGKINFLWVEPSYRLKGLGNYLLLQATKQLMVEKVTICIPSNALLEGFIRKLQFQKEKIEQYEMYIPL